MADSKILFDLEYLNNSVNDKPVWGDLKNVLLTISTFFQTVFIAILLKRQISHQTLNCVRPGALFMRRTYYNRPYP